MLFSICLNRKSLVLMVIKRTTFSYIDTDKVIWTSVPLSGGEIRGSSLAGGSLPAKEAQGTAWKREWGGMS